MSKILSELVEHLRLERIEENLFRGQSQDLGWGRVFGGQVLGQALSAATQTVPADRFVHSLHSFFLRPGDVHRPIVYEVDRIRDGSSFTTRRVVAVQAGRAIFNLAASFQVVEEGFSHQAAMPDAPDPEQLPSEKEWLQKVGQRLPKTYRDALLSSERAFDIRAVEVPDDLFAPTPLPPKRMAWLKTVAQVDEDRALHAALLAYASDFGFIGTALQPHGVTWHTPGMQVASIDHVMWFHQPVRVDDWLLYAMDSPAARGSRGLARGSIYTRDGTLVVSTAQEGLMRQHQRPPN